MFSLGRRIRTYNRQEEVFCEIQIYFISFSVKAMCAWVFLIAFQMNSSSSKRVGGSTAQTLRTHPSPGPINFVFSPPPTSFTFPHTPRPHVRFRDWREGGRRHSTKLLNFPSSFVSKRRRIREIPRRRKKLPLALAHFSTKWC